MKETNMTKEEAFSLKAGDVMWDVNGVQYRYTESSRRLRSDGGNDLLLFKVQTTKVIDVDMPISSLSLTKSENV